MIKFFFRSLTIKELAYFDLVFASTVSNSRLAEMQEYIQHGNTTCLLHCIAVAYISYRIAASNRFLSCRRHDIIRGALLHDYFLYDWHKPIKEHRLHGFYHPGIALKNAEQDFTLSKTEKDIIKKHMFPLTVNPPKCREAVLVSLVDKACSIYEMFSSDAYKNMPIKASLGRVCN